MTEPTRDELVRLHAIHSAAAAALEAKLKTQATDEHEQHRVAVSWRLPGGVVTANQAHDAAYVADEEAFFDFLEEHTAAVQRVEVRKVPGEFVKRYLLEEVYPIVEEPEALLGYREPYRSELTAGARFPVASKSNGEPVPGVTYVHGGSLVSVSLRLDSTLKEVARRAAARYADGQATFADLLEIV